MHEKYISETMTQKRIILCLSFTIFIIIILLVYDYIIIDQLKTFICFPKLKNTFLCQTKTVISKQDQSNEIDGHIKKPGYLEAEALIYLHMALDMWRRGKIDKSQKLFQHAISIYPDHPDILNAYGRFTEQQKLDLIAADYLYGRALALKPDHAVARSNKDRIGPVVDTADRDALRRVDEKMATFQRIPESDAGIRGAKMAHYYSQIYHTNAMEGNTLDMVQTRYIVETKLVVGVEAGKTVREHNEVLGLDLALRFVNWTLVGRREPLSTFDLLQIHKRIMGHVEPLTAGTLRTEQVYVGGWTPPDPDRLHSELEEFVAWLTSNDPRYSVDSYPMGARFDGDGSRSGGGSSHLLHPVEYAAIAHYHLVAIHPFADGNGRTSRLLMNLLLMRQGYPPAIVRMEDRQAYYDTLKRANRGDLRPFIRFIAYCAEASLDALLSQAKNGRTSKDRADDDVENDREEIKGEGGKDTKIELSTSTEVAQSTTRELEVKWYKEWFDDCPATYNYPVMVGGSKTENQDKIPLIL